MRSKSYRRASLILLSSLLLLLEVPVPCGGQKQPGSGNMGSGGGGSGSSGTKPSSGGSVSGGGGSGSSGTKPSGGGSASGGGGSASTSGSGGSAKPPDSGSMGAGGQAPMPPGLESCSPGEDIVKMSPTRDDCIQRNGRCTPGKLCCSGECGSNQKDSANNPYCKCYASNPGGVCKAYTDCGSIDCVNTKQCTRSCLYTTKKSGKCTCRKIYSNNATCPSYG